MDFEKSHALNVTQENTGNKISMREVVGGGYDEFWKSKQRYVVCKGSRASKKSTTAALKLIVRLMQMPLANALVVRQTAATLANSCYAQLKWAINRLGVEKYWKATINPLQMTYLPTGQKIIFRGCDDSLKLTSIAVERGHLCFAWMEEAYECAEEDFNRIDESLRGQLPEGYYIQWILSFNPWSSSSWLKSRFFDKQSENILAMTTTYKCNEWLSENDLALFKEIELTDPDRYKVVGLGEWGIESGQYFSMWRESLHVVKPFEIPRDWMKFRAMDFGQARPYAVLWFAVDYDGDMYVYRELYGWGGKPNVGTGETARQIGEKIVELEEPEENLRYGVLDSACWARTGVTAPSISEELNNVLIRKGLIPFMPSSKGRLEGANLFKQRLIGNELEDGTYKPAIKFFSTCIHCLRTIPMIGHDKHKPELPDTTAEDHCFVAGTLIHTTRGEIPIEEVTTEDEVLTRKGFRKVLAAGMTKRNAYVITVTFSNGKSLTGTPNHHIFVENKGWEPLVSLRSGDKVIDSGGGYCCRRQTEFVVKEGELEEEKADVYNLTVDEEHEYFANGFLVHNCYDAAAYGVMSRPWTPVRKSKDDDFMERWRSRETARPAWTY